MYWKLKSGIQNVTAALPVKFSYAFYYWMQRHFGGLQQINPIEDFLAGIETCFRIEKNGRSPAGKVFLEIGTGRRLNRPLAFWLLGAKKVITRDVNPYLKYELICEDIDYVQTHPKETERLFSGSPSFCEKRFEQLMAYPSRRHSLGDLLDLCDIRYLTPGNAPSMMSDPTTVDYHTSYNVLEHVAPDTLKDLFLEGSRLLSDDGLFVHRVDYTDHFSHSDSSIPCINFLQYSDTRWKKYADNRFMFVNRLRVDDFEKLFRDAHQTILEIKSEVDRVALESLGQSFKVAERFRNKPLHVLATTSSWIVSERAKPGPAST